MKFWRDEIYLNVPPGVIPGPNEPRTVGHVDGAEFSGQIAPWFTPPRGMRPAEAGVVMDSKVDARDISAIFVDLMLRGYMSMAKEGKTDWLLTPVENPDLSALGFDERALFHALFSGARFSWGTDGPTEVAGGPVLLSDRKRQLQNTVHSITDSLYRRVVENGWYHRNPKERRPLPGRWGRRPRTADGTAMRIHALGFQRYLVTAEGPEIKANEAMGVFHRYLPYAMAFGVQSQFAGRIGHIVRGAQLEGALDVAAAAAFDPSAWILLDALTDMDFGMGLGELDLGFAGDLLGGALDGAGDLLGGLAEGIGDLVGGIFDL